MRYWVLSPNVANDKVNYPVSNFVELMEEKHICLVGWHDDKPLGVTFKNEVNLGDIVIVSQRVSWKRHNYFAGIVDSDAYLYDYDDSFKPQARKLKDFTILNNKNLSFEGCSNEGTQIIPAIYELKEDKPQDKKLIDEISNYIKNTQMDCRMEKYINLLKENYNLILTGAPGTGKTYLSKQIAAKIIFNDDNKEYTEELEDDKNFKNQCQFVQFHPSYDYTDFVEGLRPIKDSDGKISFERKDGVFKDFCKKALENLIEIESITIKEYLITFANEMYNDFKKDNKITLEGISGKSVAPFTNIEFDEKKEILSMKAESQGEYTISGNINEYVDWYKLYKKLQQNETSIKGMMEDKIPKFKGKGSYLCAILNNFYEKYNSEIEKEVNNKKKNFVFIIDEINRGEISKIFGELFFAVDPGYRGVKGKVLTQYSNLIDEESEKYFYIPENVYIIGTMNDIDRSVESMDFAMRRRFAWKEVKAIDTQESILKDLDDNIKQDAIDRMNALNNAISEIEGFNSSYHIGASYFLKLKHYYKSSSDNKETAFKSLWENHLKGLLFEYLRGMPDINDKLKKLENAYCIEQDTTNIDDNNINN